ncbi:MAG: hypothetical protein ABS63_06830 [Microbacterium sp. SCN 70-27]|uniref:hypothetical protein n=1 Tax=unclassified Microbacterium TaxID=2609290 RepID=UPI000869F45D|nr:MULTISPECIES: hypothetical protein [unclassified Microbacterium]MBN9225056.1 hypothetical protein [Microbacterium sp.]ODT27891.1 MAG: hypothetical protein ABS63_06830 [Microbacterium sp. SCN 70-27]
MTLAARWTGLGATLLIVVGLAACAPGPAPSPTPTGFASEEEAFAAAEATYRAYVEAGNEERVEPTRSPSSSSFLTGRALQDNIDGEAQLAEAGVRLVGSSSVTNAHLEEWTPSKVTIIVCLDFREVRVVDADGNDVTPESRGDNASLQIDFVYSNPTPLIADSRSIGASC